MENILDTRVKPKIILNIYLYYYNVKIYKL